MIARREKVDVVYLTSHLLNEALADIGRIDYEAHLSDRIVRDMERSRDYLPALRAMAREAFRDDD